MIKQFRYYLIDSVAEKILGSFFASSDDMAYRILKGFDVNKAKLSWFDIEVLKDVSFIYEYESLSELRSISKKLISGLDLTPVVNSSSNFEDIK